MSDMHSYGIPCAKKTAPRETAYSGAYSTAHHTGLQSGSSPPQGWPQQHQATSVCWWVYIPTCSLTISWKLCIISSNLSHFDWRSDIWVTPPPATVRSNLFFASDDSNSGWIYNKNRCCVLCFVVVWPPHTLPPPPSSNIHPALENVKVLLMNFTNGLLSYRIWQFNYIWYTPCDC